MTSGEREKGKINKPSEQALLTEYQACQHDIDSSAHSYWTLAGIFIGVSSVLLAGIIYGVLANNTIFSTLDCTLRTLITIFSAAIIFILVFLCFWLKRETYLADRNYERMREIEIKLGMQKSLRVPILDEWKKLGFKRSDALSDKEIDERWKKLKGKLQEGLPPKCFEKLDERKKELVEFCNRYPSQKWYERPSRELHYKVIFGTLFALWLILITIVWIIN